MPPTARKVSTPGSGLPVRRVRKARSKKRVGRPVKEARGKKRRLGIKHRALYTEEDMLEAVRLVSEENFTIKAAALATNNNKLHAVPRMTLSNRLSRTAPDVTPALGRPVELSCEVEQALVDSLRLCGEYHYPMRKSDLQKLVQAYCVQNEVTTRWVNQLPAREWVRLFLKRWSHKIKLRRPKNIKRSRASVSPRIIRDFFTRAAPNLEGIPATHIMNYDETNLQGSFIFL